MRPDLENVFGGIHMRYLLFALTLFAAVTKAETNTGSRAVLWQAPHRLTRSDWIWGSGGKGRAPLAPFQFVKENLGGTNPKIEVRDARGALWIVKFGGEVHPETFASRLLYATGYAAEPVYFVGSGVVANVHGLKRARSFVSKDGGFHNARFKLRENSTLAYANQLKWSWTESPFTGSRELSGLKILIMLVSNWDTKDARDGNGSNTAVFHVLRSEPDTYLYSFTDWGASMGHWGGFFKRTKWDASSYQRQTRKFVRTGKDGRIVWGFEGKHGQDITAGITVEDIRWLLPYLERVTEREWQAGLLASGATAANAERFTRAIRERIRQLEAVGGADTLAENRSK